MAYDFSQLEKGIAGAKEWLGREYKGLRTGRATPAILDSVQVSVYGSMQPIKHVATVSVEDARTLRIQPFDPSVVKDIERAIAAADLGLGMVPDQSGIRVTFPDLTTERRNELIKVAKGKLEDARARIRAARDECWKDIQEQEKMGGMGEDEKFRLKDEMQKKVDAGNEALEAAFETKEKEMTS
jgi:ribosome recycling factor